MKYVTFILSLFFLVALALGAKTDDQKKVKTKKVTVKTMEKKAGLGILVANNYDKTVWNTMVLGIPLSIQDY